MPCTPVCAPALVFVVGDVVYVTVIETQLKPPKKGQSSLTSPTTSTGLAEAPRVVLLRAGAGPELGWAQPAAAQLVHAGGVDDAQGALTMGAGRGSAQGGCSSGCADSGS